MTMATKNIIVPCDGTWHGLHTNTNVRRLATMITNIQNAQNVLPPNGIFQGVGIGNGANAVIDGAIARDLDNRVKEAYRFVVTSYDPARAASDHNVWLFGFSRGAYIVRSVAGMIRNCGVVTRHDVVDIAYNIYRNKERENHPDGQEAVNFRQNFSHNGSDRCVFFIGLWDTVGAHGLPSYSIAKGFEYLEFHDRFISAHINYAYQALAVHENLEFFEPCRIFRSTHSINPVEEIWFPGIHGEIGGSDQSSPISNETLNWMIDNINRVTDGNISPVLGGNVQTVPVNQLAAPIRPSLFSRFLSFVTQPIRMLLGHHIRRDREIPGASSNVLYRAGLGWTNIARGSDYSSNAYNAFRQRCIPSPPPLP